MSRAQTPVVTPLPSSYRSFSCRKQREVAYNYNEGDIRALYRLVREPLNRNPAGEGITGPLKPILEGLQKLVSGLYEISIKAGDRPARRYNPAGRHAPKRGQEFRVRPSFRMLQAKANWRVRYIEPNWTN